jgi:hypothetical protein
MKSKRKQLIEQYNDIFTTIYEDEEMLMKVMIEQFGSAYDIWQLIHTHVTCLNEERDLDDYQLEEEVEEVVEAYRKVVDDMVEQELLSD